MTNTGKSLFNRKLFLDGMRQLRIIGVMALVIYCIEAFFAVFGTNMNLADYAEHASTYNLQYYAGVQIYNLITIHPILIATIYIVAPIMLLYLFGFMNKRNSSDFYYSVPVSRAGLMITYLASVMAWLFIIIAGSSVVTCAAAFWAPYVALNKLSVLVNLLAILCGCLAVLGGGLIAMSLTGTYFSNFTVSMMVLLFPRLLFLAYLLIISDILPVFTVDLTGTILDYQLNIIVAPFITLLEGDFSGCYNSIFSVLYTLVLAALYLSAALWLFTHRKSEIATMPAGSRRLQTLFRLLPAFVITIMPMSFICTLTFNKTYDDGSLVFYTILFYIIAIVVYFLYELMTTKKLVNILRSFRGLWILAASNIIFLLFVFLSHTVILNDTPDENKIRSVRVYEEPGSGSSDYFDNMMLYSGVTDKSFISMLSGILEDNIADIKAGQSLSSYYYSVTVEFKTGIRTVKRRLLLNEQQTKQYRNLLVDVYQDIYTQLPSEQSIDNLNIDLYGTGSNAGITGEEAVAIYRTYREEVENLSAKQAVELNGADILMNNRDAFGYIRGTYTQGLKNYTYNVYITKDTPKTMLQTILALNQFAEGNPIADYLSYTADIVPDEMYQLEMRLYDTDGKIYTGDASANIDGNGRTGYTENGGKILEEMAKELDTQSGKAPASANVPFFGVSITVYTVNGNQRESYVYYCEATEKLSKLFFEFTDYYGRRYND